MASRCIVWFGSCLVSLYVDKFIIFSVLLFVVGHFILSFFHVLSFMYFILCASMFISLMSEIVTSVYSFYLISRLSWRHRISILVLVFLVYLSSDIGLFDWFHRAIYLYVHFFFFIKTFHGGCLNFVFNSYYIINQYIELARHFSFIWVIWTFFLKFHSCHFSFVICASLFHNFLIYLLLSYFFVLFLFFIFIRVTSPS